MCASTSSLVPAGTAALAVHQRRWLLWRAQKMAFWLLYDFAGALVFLNVCSLAVVSLPVWLLARVFPGQLWLALVVGALAVLVALAAQVQLIAVLLAGEAFSLRPWWRGVARILPGLLVLGASTMACSAVAGLGVWYYLAQLGPANPVAGYALAGVCGGSGALVLLLAMFWLPALVHQQGSARRAARIGFLLLARHPVLALGLGAVIAGQAMLLATPPGVLLLSTLPVVALSCCVYELLDRAHTLDAALARGEPAPAGTLDENDIFLNRGFTDLLYPWKV